MLTMTSPHHEISYLIGDSQLPGCSVMAARPSTTRSGKTSDKELHQAILNGEIDRFKYLASTRPGLLPEHLQQATFFFRGYRAREQAQGKRATVDDILTVVVKHVDDLVLCKYLLLEGADVNKNSPLSASLAMGFYDKAKLLIDWGANLNSLDEGKSPLFYAIKEDSPVSIVKDLLKAGADKNGIIYVDSQKGSQCLIKRTPLICAILKRNIPVVRYLLSQSVDVNLYLDETSSALFAAVFMDSLVMVKLLVEAGANVEGSDQGRIFHLALNRNVEIIKLLVRKCLYINTMINPCMNTYVEHNGKLVFSRNGTRLHMAVALCRHEAVRILIDNGANINIQEPKDNLTPLHIASIIREPMLEECDKKNYLKTIDLLLENGADFLSTPLNPIHFFVQNECWCAIEKIIKFGIDFNRSSFSTQPSQLLTLLLSCNKFDLIKLSLDFGADCSKPFALGSLIPLPLIMALKTSDSGLVRTILKHTPPLSATDYEVKLAFSQHPSDGIRAVWDSEIALLESIRENNAEKAKTALESGAIPNGSIIGSEYPLHKASELGFSKVVEVLLAYNSTANHIDSKGWSPLHVAASKGHVSICKSLLRHGATYNYQDKKGLSPLKVARTRQVLGSGHEDVEKLLRKVHRLFQMVGKGNTRVFKILEKTVKSQEILVYTNCVNRQGYTLIGEALNKGYKDIAEDILYLKFESSKLQKC